MSTAIDKLAKSLLQIMQETNSRVPNGYDTEAKVTRVEGDTVWVKIPGGTDETPIQKTNNANVGDTVVVRVSDGRRAWLIGNSTSPATDDTVANVAVVQAEEAKKMASDANNNAIKLAAENAKAMATAVININADIADLQDQVDGNITTWFYAYVPTTSNYPASEWITQHTENVHLGDLFYNTTTGYAYRWMSDGASTPTYSWLRITDSDATKALEDAAKAQDTADSKRRVFVSEPTPPYDVGDLWVQGSTGDILRCAQAKTSSGTYAATDWVKASKYTDDSALNTWLTNTYATDKQTLEGLIDSKIETWYQTSDPSTGWTAAQKTSHTGDIWYNSTSSVQKYYRYNGSSWDEITATPPQAVMDTVDGKAQVFVGTSTPNPPYAVGDLWYQGDGYEVLTCTTAKTASQSYDASDWEKYDTYATDGALSDLSTTMTGKIEDASDLLNGRIDSIDTQLEAKAERSAVSELTQDVQKYLGENGYIDVQNGTMIIATGSEIGNFQIVIDGTQIGFYEDDVCVAYISGKKLYISKAEITDEMKISSYAWVRREGGRLTLMYVG